MEDPKNKLEEDRLLSSFISVVDDFFGDPQVLPRVGDEFQVKIPLLSPNDNNLQSESQQTASKVLSNKEAPILSDNVCSVPQVDGINTHLGVENCSENFQLLDVGDGNINPSFLNSWSDTGYNSFLLSLYTFGKDFNLVKRFVEGKQMGDILLFYYGKFYGSTGYRRWSDCRKAKSRRCVSGQKIYSGWRLQELLSRLSSRISVVCQTLLIEASRMFEQGSTPFEDYVFTLKETVGTANLVEAVGIGTGKQDLTNTAESSRKYNALPARPEIPVGEAWSSLSLAEIVKVLRGDFRLSKARSNDLFWEAVWPRLLAKGWHSEQPKDHSVSGSRHSLVFLIPGIQEFSRDSLMKGNDYFDSVTDILNKVASDPSLLELHREAEDGVPLMEEFKHKTSTVSDMNGVIKRPSRQYLQPRISKGNFNSMMFMIVDTSLIRRGKSTARELRHLPVELIGLSANSFNSNRKRRYPSEGPDTNHESSSISMIEDCVIDRGTSSQSSSCLAPDNADKTKCCPAEDVTEPKDLAKYDFCLAERKPVKTLKKRRKNREIKSPGHSCDAGIMVEQQNSAVLPPEQIKVESCDIPEGKLHESECSCCTSLPMKSKKMVLSLFASRSFPKTSLPTDSLKDVRILQRCQDPSTSLDGDDGRAMIDLNLPQVFNEPIAEEPAITESGLSCSTASASLTEQQPDVAKPSNCSSTTETTTPSRDCRRQSTRNRPLTTRALEAIECGLLEMKRNRKRKKYTKRVTRSFVETNTQPATSDDGTGDGNDEVSRISLTGAPGGAEAFELAAKFCYGINIEISLSNVATLRCVAHYLEMTEDFAEKNLATRAESYIKEVVLPNISDSITVLHRCESLLPVSEEISLVGRLITAIASNACKEQLASGLCKLDRGFPRRTLVLKQESETPSDWWGKLLVELNLDFFQRVLSAVKSKGLKQDMISQILVNYARTSLQGYFAKDSNSGLTKGSAMELDWQKKQRVIVEAIVSLLPTQSRKSRVPMAFLSSLLKTAIGSGASTSSRVDLERRIGLQLDQAILEDILIPTTSSNGNNSHVSAMYDTDSVYRIFSVFLNLDEDEDDDGDEEGANDGRLKDETEMAYDFDSPGSPKQSAILKVSKTLDAYLAEVALDANLSPSKFIALAELLPDHARLASDGLYRAVDIFLKVHPNIKDSDRYRLCKAIDCQRLSPEACSHAAQNERLPVQMAVQVLYFEQIRLKNAMNGGSHNQFFYGSIQGQFQHRSGSTAGSGAISPRDNYASVRRENRELKLEVARMRMRLTDLEKDHVLMKQELIVKTQPANKLFKSLTKKLSKLNSLFRLNGIIKPIGSKAKGIESQSLFQKRRRHSIS